MNDPPSDGNESVNDIFVLSVSETVVPLFTEHLEKKGYRVTLFTDGTYLLETLKTGKPNLLICDTTTLDNEGFEVCRQIKADDDFWVIPVLILTSASTLTDLLHVLDCNADNFLPHPFDLSYNLSIIESMLGTPVERQTPDQIKTQFKISHDDRIYVVAANRRKLLEFLLSSFEIAVNKSSELSHTKTELQTLSESAIHLEDCVTEQTRVIDTVKATLQQKEQKISTLTHEVEEKKKLLAQKTDEIEQLAEKLDHHKALIVTYDGNIRKLIQEKKDIDTSYCSEIDTLRQQISELSNEVDTIKTSLDTIQGDLEEEKIHSTSLECTLELIVQQKELAEKSLRSLTGEHEQLISAFEGEKNRATSAEQEIQTVMQAKTQSEQELTQIITALNEIKQQQAADLTRLKGELEEESCQRISAEDQLGSLRQDKEQLASSIRSLTGEHEQLKSALEAEKNRATSAEQEIQTVMQAKTRSEQELTQIITALNEIKQQQAADLTRLKGELEEESCQRISAEDQLGSLQQDKEQLASSLRSLTGEHGKLKSAFAAEENRASSAEQEHKTVLQSKTQSEQELTQIITALNEIKQQQAADLTRLKGELEEESCQRISAEDQLELLQQDKEQSESTLRSSITALKGHLDELQVQLETTSAALQNEENTSKLLKENLAEAVAENEKTEVRVKEDLESYKTTFIRLKRDLDEATAIPKTLERDLDAAKVQNKALVDELNLANQSRAQSVQQVRSFGDELEKVKAALDTERSLHQAGEKSIEALMQTMQCLEQDLRASVEERDKLNEILENEQRLRLIAEDTSKAAAQEQEHLKQDLRAVTDEQARQENDRALKIQNLEKEFELVCNLQKSLEEQVNILTKEKLQAEQNVKALTGELDQARIALADEWVDHMASDQSFAAAIEEPQPQKQSFSPEEAAGIEKEKGQEIIVKESDLPVIVESSSHELVMVITPDIQKSPVSENELTSHEPSKSISEVSPEAVTDIVNTFCDEDLFEEDEPVVIKADLAPKPTGVTESEPEKTSEEFSIEFPVSHSEKGEEAYPDVRQTDEDAIEEPEKDSTGKISEGPVLPVVFSFNRKQWFDLLKWAHHSTKLTHDQRLQIVRMGRLIQKDRKLTRKQEEQVKEMIALVQAMGYRPS
jgi:DNA-binding response OmpR family regulator/predicted HAD superfamily Cof-like phosphohydrolase